VGVDVERISPLSVGDFRSVFTPREMAAINDSLWPQSELIRRWTIKEAILKALGLGFLADPLALDTSPREPERLVETKAGPLRWDHLDLAQDFWLSWAILDTER
jgi:phosphopantetheine--protein transferase-like protein